MNVRRAVGWAIYALSAAIGVLAFLYPFFSDATRRAGMGTAHGQDALLVTTVMVALSLSGILVELQGQALGAKTVAMLGVLVATASVLRFIEIAIPVPGGFSPIFVPIILGGYVFGGRFGFMLGAFTLLTSGLVTGGVGPWLPYQMFAAGWAGMTAGWLRLLRPRHTGFDSYDMALLLVFGFAWGLAYGAIMNVYFWPFAVGQTDQVWTPGTGIQETLRRYAAFYLATSLWWDLVRAVGNVLLLLLLAAPTVRALERFRRRFHFEVAYD